ncbi:ILA, partial [Symbiodinium microadriaticum]
AAFGVSAFVKGMGIPSIKNHDIVNRLKEACTSGSINQRQGALFAFELLSERLGMLFEPYVISIVPLLLKSFSHSSDHVRDAAQDAARVIMAKLSAHGVKQVLTPILASLPTEKAWKSKQEALRLLGTMAFCESAKKSLADISSVIRNPEVSSLAPTLIAALTEPANKTKPALDALLECEFMHSIDAPSLAILIPILTRALRDRGGDLKRKSAIILGNMCSMISDAKIIVPYLEQVIPGLQDVLLDPIPDIRATCAKELSDLVPWLMRTMKGDSSPVERSGAAQGLAEVCLALGDQRIADIVADAIQLSRSASAFAREGLLWLLTFLPSVLGEPFAEYITSTLPIVLSGLSDDAEGVRDVSMRAGQ